MPDPVTKPQTVVGLGELLWDLLPSGKQLGGAPANFAYISSLFGNRGVVASRVGTDALGDEAIDRLATLGLEDSCVQRDRSHATGTVGVEIDQHRPADIHDFRERRVGPSGVDAGLAEACGGS